MSLGRSLIIIVLFTALAPDSIGQIADPVIAGLPDSGRVQLADKDSVKKKRHHSPKLASVLSAVAPGAGQIYNRKYWKLPIIYGAFGGFIYSAVWNHGEFRTYKDAYLLRIDDDPMTIDEFDGQFSDENLLSLQSDYRRNRDLSYIFIGVFYALNIIDAAVDAHLFDFNVDENLSLEIKPVIEPMDYQQAQAYGVGLSLRLR